MTDMGIFSSNPFSLLGKRRYNTSPLFHGMIQNNIQENSETWLKLVGGNTEHGTHIFLPQWVVWIQPLSWHIGRTVLCGHPLCSPKQERQMDIVWRRVEKTGQHMAKIYVYMLSHFSHVRLFAALWTVGHQAPLSMGFSRQEYWSGLLYPPTGNLSNPGIKSVSLTSPALAGGFLTTSI